MHFLGSSVFLGDDYPGPLADLGMAESQAKGRAAAQPKVLVVDDEKLLADTTAAILRRAGFTAKAAYDAFGALDMMVSFRPDYLLTDIMMPAMNGVELAIAIAKVYPKTRILLFSGQAGITEILEESKTRGFEFPLLAKPVHPSKLVEGLKQLGNG
jgi:DNA-binding NtrC family response regulator